jgi:hypothetical protein
MIECVECKQKKGGDFLDMKKGFTCIKCMYKLHNKNNKQQYPLIWKFGGVYI